MIKLDGHFFAKAKDKIKAISLKPVFFPLSFRSRDVISQKTVTACLPKNHIHPRADEFPVLLISCTELLKHIRLLLARVDDVVDRTLFEVGGRHRRDAYRQVVLMNY